MFVRRSFFIALVLLLSSLSVHSKIYKYKNENGSWVYTDKPPEEQINAEEIKTGKVKEDRPDLFVTRRSSVPVIIAKNPYFAPVEFRISAKGIKPFYAVVDPQSEKVVKKSDKAFEKVEFTIQIGERKNIDPDIDQGYKYLFPVGPNKPHLITQSFIGKYSHNGPANKYAVDVGLTVGTPIIAARDGIVVFTERSNWQAGIGSYFVDKANYVTILHNDGTYAVYAHLLRNSVAVKPGQQVKQGEVIAQSGNTGYSTGPHLHFVIRQNYKFGSRAIRFQFKDRFGNEFEPSAGMKVYGSN